MDAIIEDKAYSGMTTVVRLIVPRALEFVPLARVTVAGYAARLGFDVDEIEDSRIAIDELARVLVEVGDGDSIELELEGAEHRLDLAGTSTCSNGAEPPQLDPITSQILGAICAEYGVLIDSGTVRFRAAILSSTSR